MSRRRDTMSLLLAPFAGSAAAIGLDAQVQPTA
jgi:hypothetical protein